MCSQVDCLPSEASLFNKFFYSVFTTTQISTPNDDVMDTSATNHISISQDKVYRALVTLDHSKATGIVQWNWT